MDENDLHIAHKHGSDPSQTKQVEADPTVAASEELAPAEDSKVNEVVVDERH